MGAFPLSLREGGQRQCSVHARARRWLDGAVADAGGPAEARAVIVPVSEPDRRGAPMARGEFTPSVRGMARVACTVLAGSSADRAAFGHDLAFKFRGVVVPLGALGDRVVRHSVRDVHRAHDASTLGLSQDGIAGRLQTAAARERQAQDTVKVVTQYVDRVRVVREKGDTIIKEIPVYVPVQADAACTINRGFVRLHDAAAAGELPEPARDADAAAAGIALSAVAGTLAANYQTCHENAEQLRALQVWVSEMPSATN